MKKSTKSSKPAAPQVKSVVPKSVAPKPAKQTKAPARTKAAPKTTPKVKKTVKAAPKPLPSHPVASRVTTITAKIDIGFGNTLYLRGEGPGLSWHQGTALDCVDDDKWSITLPGALRPVICKFLVNDLTWSTGSDFVIEPGAAAVLVPAF